MAISLSDLPEQYQAQAVAQLKRNKGGKQIVGRKNSFAPTTAYETKSTSNKSKYSNQPTTRITKSGKVIHFDSIKEAKRYDELMLRLFAGEIRDLKLQADFTLQEAFTDAEGIRTQALKYQADFAYYERIKQGDTSYVINPLFDVDGWRYVVEDVKSQPTRTEKYRIKKKLLKEKYGIDIVEI